MKFPWEIRKYILRYNWKPLVAITISYWLNKKRDKEEFKRFFIIIKSSIIHQITKSNKQLTFWRGNLIFTLTRRNKKKNPTFFNLLVLTLSAFYCMSIISYILFFYQLAIKDLKYNMIIGCCWMEWLLERNIKKKYSIKLQTIKSLQFITLCKW